MCVAYPFIGGLVNTMTTEPEHNEDRRNPDQGSGITRIRATDRGSFRDDSDDSIGYLDSRMSHGGLNASLWN